MRLQVNNEMKVAILDALGIPYLLLEAGDSLILFVNQETLGREIEKYRTGGVSADALGTIQTEATNRKLAPDWAKVREMIAAAPLEGESWDFDYRLCEEMECTVSTPHAYLYPAGAVRPVFMHPAHSIFGAIVQMHQLHVDGMDNIPTATHLMKQAVELLPLNEDPTA